MSVRFSLAGAGRSLLVHPTVVGTFLVGLITTAAAGLWMTSIQREDATEAFEEKSTLVADSLSRAVSEARTRVLGLQGLFAASEEVTEEEFREYAVRVSAPEGSHRLGFARRVLAEDLTEFLAETRVVRPDFSFRIDESGLNPERQVSVHYPIWFLVDFEMTSDLVGLDLASLPGMDAAIDGVISFGDAVVAGLLDGCDDTAPCEVTVLAPARDVDGSTGVVFSTLRLGQLLNRLVGDLGDGLHWSVEEVAGDQPTTNLEEADRWLGTIDVFGRRWRLEVFTEQPYQPLSSTGLRFVVLLGIAGSFFGALSVYAIGDDIKARRRIERLEQLHRERDRFLATLSHELRTPLTAVVGVLKILATNWQDSNPDEVQELLDTAEVQASELSDLTDDLLLVGRATSGTLSFVHQNVDLLSTVKDLLPRLDVQRNISVCVSDADAIVWADPGRVRQILRNVISNALRYTHSAVRFEAETEADRVRLLIRNDGPPIVPDNVRFMFEPYASGHTARHPSPIGLGLYVSRLLAEAMDGSLSYAYDGWVVFTLELPAPPHQSTTSRSTTTLHLERSR